MFDDTHTVDLSSKDLALIEAALHTQQKILSVQSKAGRAGAKDRLADLKHLLKRLRRKPEAAPKAGAPSLAQMARSLFC